MSGVSHGYARAQCVDYGADAVHWVAEFPTGGSPISLVAAGNLLYVANGTAGLAVVDVANPVLPELLGAVDTPGTVRHVELDGADAVVAASDGGLGIIDVSDPKHPVTVAFIDTPGNASQVALGEGVAYVADRDAGLTVVDISERTDPRVIGGLVTPGSAMGLVLAGDHVYLVDQLGLMIIDVSEPTAPRSVGWIDTPGNPLNVTLAGDLAVVSDSYGGLTVVDVHDVRLPQVIGNTGDGDYGGGSPAAAVVDGDLAFVAAFSSGWYDVGSCLRTYDLSDPSRPKLVGAAQTGGTPQGLVLRGDYAYLAVGSRGIAIVDISTRTGPHVLDAWPGGIARAVDFARWCAVVVGDFGYFVTYDVTRSHDLRRLGSLYVSGDLVDVAVSGTLACAARSYSGLVLIDIGDPVHPALAGSVAMTSYVSGVATSGSYAFVANGGNGLRVVDFSVPSAAEIVATCATPAPAYDVVISDRYAYVALGGSGGLAVVDVADPLNPVLVGHLATGTAARYVAVSDAIAYLSLGEGGLLIVDVSDPTRPRTLAGEPVERSAAGLAVSGHYVYLLDSLAGLQVIDVSDSTDPRTLYRVCVPTNGVSVNLDDECVYLACGNSGLVTIPRQCDTAVSVHLPEFTMDPVGAGVRLRWRVGVTAAGSGFRVWREAPGTGRQLLTADVLSGRLDYEYVDDRPSPSGADYWLEELPADAGSVWHGPLHFDSEVPSASLRLQQNQPNPFNPMTTLRYDLPRPGRVRLTIHDLRGALVATLVDADLTAGGHAADWSGLGDQGVPVASGVYVARLETSQGTRAVTLTLAR